MLGSEKMQVTETFGIPAQNIKDFMFYFITKLLFWAVNYSFHEWKASPDAEVVKCQTGGFLSLDTSWLVLIWLS